MAESKQNTDSREIDRARVDMPGVHRRRSEGIPVTQHSPSRPRVTRDTITSMDEDEIVDILSGAIPVLGVAFAAFCVWLGVRVYNRQERWAKWVLATALIGVPVLYVVSYGVVCRVTSQQTGEWLAKNVAAPPNGVVTAIYWPLGAAAANNALLRRTLHRYLRLWVPGGRIAVVPIKDDGHIMAFELR